MRAAVLSDPQAAPAASPRDSALASLAALYR